jgi:hypothetical protein
MEWATLNENGQTLEMSACRLAFTRYRATAKVANLPIVLAP